jgi:hypothetical protein
MFNRVKYFITKNFKQPSTKERLNKIKNKVNTPKKSLPPIIIRKYHTSNTNFNNNNNNNNKPPNYNMLIICSIVIGTYFNFSRKKSL